MPEENTTPIRSHLTPQTPTQKQRYCHHPRITVDEGMRLLHCKDCDLWIEPFDYLMGWAQKDWAAERMSRHHDEEVRKLCKEKLELKRQVRNIKAHIKRLRVKVIVYEQALKG